MTEATELRRGIRLSYNDLNSPLFNQVVMKIYKSKSIKDIKISLKVASLMKELRTNLEAARSVFAAKSKDYFVDYEQDVTERGPDGKEFTRKVKGQKVIEGKEEEWEKIMKEFMETPVQLRCPIFQLEDLQGAELTPEELESSVCLFGITDF